MPIVRDEYLGRAMLVLAMLLAGSALAVLADMNGWDPPGEALDGIASGIVSFGRAFAPLIFVSTAAMILIVEGGAMVSEAFLRRRYKRGFEEGLEEGLEQANAEWEAWRQRMLAAQRAGEEFDEPPPNGKTRE